MEKLQVGQQVKILKWWEGEGQIVSVYADDQGYEVTALTGEQTGMTGGFELDEVEAIEVPITVVEAPQLTTLEILTVKRPEDRNLSMKLYGTVRGNHGKVYKFAYFRRAGFRGWNCSCDSFFNRQSDHFNCKHLNFVRAELGRYGSKVPR